MNFLVAALMTALLAFPADGDLQLCQHHSGESHVFSGKNRCDGEHGHSQSRDHDDHEQHDDHGHGDHHSSHEAPGEHHEPCEHDTISSGDELASRLNPLHFSQILIAHFVPFEKLSFGEWRPQMTDKQKLYVTRGPPGDGGPQGHFHATIRLLI